MALRPEDPVLDKLRTRVQDLVAPNFCWGTALLDSTEGGLFYRKTNDSDARYYCFIFPPPPQYAGSDEHSKLPFIHRRGSQE